MPKTIKYIGSTVRWPELAYTGKQSVWQPGQIEQRSDTIGPAIRSGQLLAMSPSEYAAYMGGRDN